MLCDSSRTSRNRVPQKITVLVLATSFAHFGWAAESVPQERPPQEEQAALRHAEATGLTIYTHDHAAAVATDALLALGSLKSDKRMQGWITEEHGPDVWKTARVDIFEGNDAAARQIGSYERNHGGWVRRDVCAFHAGWSLVRALCP
jgi:hypothetical protein